MPFEEHPSPHHHRSFPDFLTMTALEGPESPILSLPSSSTLHHHQQQQKQNDQQWQPKDEQRIVSPPENSKVSRLVSFEDSPLHHSGENLPEHSPVSPPASDTDEQTVYQTEPSFHQEDPSSPTSSSHSSSPEHANSSHDQSPSPPVINDTKKPSSKTSASSKHDVSMHKSRQFCPNCHHLTQQNHRLDRRVAHLRMRLQESTQTAQTHGQRLLRAAFQDKLREITTTHAHRTTDMLNMQKKCFEDELQAMENEASSAIQALQKQLDDERDERDQLVFRYERERNDALEKNDMAMQEIQEKLAQMQATVTRVEDENAQLEQAHHQKQLMIDVLASTAAAKDVERRRLAVLENGQEEERKRKNSLIDSLQGEIVLLRKQLEIEADQSRNMSSKVARLEKERRDECRRYEQDLEDCKQESKTQIDRMGRLFASMIQDVAHVASDPSPSN